MTSLMDRYVHPYFLRALADDKFVLYGMNADNTMYIELKTFTNPIAAKLTLDSYNRAQIAAEHSAP